MDYIFLLIIFTYSRKSAIGFTPGVFQGVYFKVFISFVHSFGIVVKEKRSPFNQGIIHQPIMSINKVITPMTELSDPPSYCEADLRLCFRICRLLVYYSLGLSGCFRKLFAFKPPIHISLSCYQCLYSNFVTYFGCHDIPKRSKEKGTSRQRSGKGAIRKRFPLQKPRRENPKLTIRYIYHENI